MTTPNQPETETKPEIPQLKRYTEQELEAALAAGTLDAPAENNEPPAGDPPAVEPPVKPEAGLNVADLAAEVEKLKKANEDARVFNERRGTEIGQLRKEAAEWRKTAQEALEIIEGKREPRDPKTDFLVDPKKAVIETLEEVEAKKRADAENRANLVAEAKEIVKAWDPEFDEGNVRRAMLLDVKEEAQVDEFVRGNLYGSPILAHQLNRVGKLLKKVETLEAELAEAKKKPAETVKKIAAAAKAPQGTAGAQDSPPKTDRRDLSLAEIQALLKQHRKRG